MTDNEIIKALECCLNDKPKCNQCPLEYECGHNLFDDVRAKYALDLINRQKAEIERLQKHIKEGIVLARQLPELASAIRAEAIKEFAERLKALPECQDVPAVLAVIDDLVKEMVGDSDEN